MSYQDKLQKSRNVLLKTVQAGGVRKITLLFLVLAVCALAHAAPLPTPSARAEPLHVKSWSITEYSLTIEFATSSGALAETVRITRKEGPLVIETEPAPVEDGGKFSGTLTPGEVQAGGVGGGGKWTR